VRGGLDDALDKLARRDELRRRAAGETNGTPPAVTELVEAIAAVVAHHPELAVTVGVEGAGDPVLLRFFSEDGQVQVNADNAVTARAAEPAPATHRHADFDIDPDDPVEELHPGADPYQAPVTYPSEVADYPPASAGFPAAPAEYRSMPPDGGTTQRLSRDDQDRYGPATFGHHGKDAYVTKPDTAERRYGSFDRPPTVQDARYPQRDIGETSRDLGARMRDLGMASRDATTQPYQPHPYAPTPPPPVPAQTTRRIRPEHHRAPEEPSAAERIPSQPPQQRGMPTPLPKPIPLQVERPEETEMAARRLAALLRDDPSLLNQAPD
jgi:hypothetical protein